MTVAKRDLGRTGLQVTTLGYGAMELRGAPRARDITEEQAETILNKVLDSGINYIDTSIDYGLSEERIGRYISHRRAEYYLASKCGCLVGAPPAPRGQRGAHVFTRDNVVAGVEQSLAQGGANDPTDNNLLPNAQDGAAFEARAENLDGVFLSVKYGVVPVVAPLLSPSVAGLRRSAGLASYCDTKSGRVAVR